MSRRTSKEFFRKIVVVVICVVDAECISNKRKTALCYFFFCPFSS